MTDDGTCSVCDALARARAGDRAAFAALVRGHQSMVYSLALRMLSDPHQAEDLAQEVFLRLHRKLTLVQSDTHLMFWLRQVATRLAIDRLRSEPGHQLLPLEESAQIAGAADRTDPLLQRQLRSLIARLPPAARAVVVLRYQEDLDPADIAQLLGMPVNTVKSHLKRSLASLREMLTAAGPQAPSGEQTLP